MNPYQKSKEQGYSDPEILEFLSTHPKYSEKIKKSRESGYSDDDIVGYLSGGKDQEEDPERTVLQSTGRIVGQTALGVAENLALPYELAVGLNVNKPVQVAQNRERILSEISDLQEKKYLSRITGTGDFKPQHQEQLDYYNDLIKNPEKLEESISETAFPDISIRGMTEKATGLDLQPEGILEKAAHWAGFLKDPKKIKDLVTFGLKPFEAIKAILPTPLESMRGLGAGTALEMAEQGEFGPWGTLAMAVMGDVAGHGPKAIFKAATQPKQTVAKAVNLFTGGNSKKAWSNELINQAKESGIQLDAGSITGSPFIQWMQARAAQSGLSGKALEEFRKDLSGQILREYNAIGDELGNMTFENNHQASEAIKSSLKVQESNLLKFLPEESPAQALEDSRKGISTGRTLQGRIAEEARPVAENEMLLDRIAPERMANDYIGGETLKTAAEDIKNPIKEELSQRRQAFNQRVEMIPAGPQRELAQEMEAFVNDNRGSLLLGESTPEHRVVRAAENLFETLRDEHGLLRDIALRELLLTKTTLQDVANYEFGGSNFQSKYKKLADDVDRAIRRTLARTSEPILEEFNQFNADYAHFKDTFENKNVMKLFEPKNHNYNAIYGSYVGNPDNLRSLEDMFYASPRGQEIINQVKRDYAQRVISQRNIDQRDIDNLIQTLGPEFADDINGYWNARQFLEANPQARAAIQPRLGMEVPIVPKQATKGRTLGVKQSDIHTRKKMYEFLKGKSSEQVMKMFDTIEGIRKMRSVLNLTEEGKQLFKDLSRFKLSEMIDKNMKNNMTEQVKLGTFSNLLKTTKNKAIAKELLGADSFNRLIKLQKNSGKLAESANKFFNASQSGTTLTDVSLVSTAVLGVMTGNPYLALPAIAKIGGMRVVANLFADKEFLKILEEVVLSPKALRTPLELEESLRRMQPYVQQALLEAKNHNENQRES